MIRGDLWPRATTATAAVALLAALLWSGTASAQLAIDIGVGVKGGVNFSGITKPGTKELNGRNVDYPYPGFFGVGGGGGLFIEPRFLGIIGLEIGFLYESSQGSGDLEFNTPGFTAKEEVVLSSTDLVIPIHVKAALPMAPLVSFLVGIGADIAIPLGQEIETGSIQNLKVKEREMATYFGFQFGVEIDLKIIRIPIELRGRWNPGYEDNFNPRLDDPDPPGGEISFIPDWELQGMFYVGAIYPFDIL